jgi:hypothetical protein
MDCCDHHSGLGWVPRWMGFTDYVPTLPQLYWNVDGNEQRFHLLCKQLHELVCYADMLGQKIDLDHAAIDELEKQFEKFMESGFDEYYKEQIEAWIEAHMPDIIGQTIKMVYFGLTDDGHFCAYIPDAWSDITFDTGAVFGRTDYGRLILRFEADGAIDNTYSYSLAQPEALDQLIADLEVNAKRTDASFDTLFTNLDEEVVLNGNI